MVNFQRKRNVTIHDELRGFRAGRGPGTSTLEEKFPQQLAGIAHEPLLQVLLDMWKVYDSLDRGSVHGNSVGVRDGPEHGAPNFPSLGQPHFCPQVKTVPRNSFWDRERSHVRRPCVPHEILYCDERGGESGIGGNLQTTGGASQDGLGGRRARPDTLHG